jgi:hypothetical protein
MNNNVTLRYCFLILLGLSPVIIPGQEPLPNQTAGRSVPRQLEQGQTQMPKLSPGADEVAREIGVMPLIERLYALPDTARGVGGGTMSLEALSLRQEITETVFGTALEVDGVIAEIDNETAKLSSVRADLEARRDRAQSINNIASIVTGGALGVVGSALQFKNSTANLGNIIGVSGGAASVVLSIIGIRQQNGGLRALGRSPNMLAKLFDQKPEFHSDYPDEVWTYLNHARPVEPESGSRKSQLIEEWKQGGRIESSDSRKGQAKIAVVTSSVSHQIKLSIDQISDRQAMLADVRAEVSLMKRDLSQLMRAIRPSAK